METLKEIGNKQFNDLQKQHGTRELKDKITSLEQEITRLSWFAYEHELLSEPLLEWILDGKVKISEIPRAVRMSSYGDELYVYAWRYAEAKQDAFYGMRILTLLQEDIKHCAVADSISQTEYVYRLEQWIKYMARGKMVFKGDENFERYFQEQKTANRSLFDTEGL